MRTFTGESAPVRMMLLFVLCITFVSVCKAATPTQADMDIVRSRILEQYTPAPISTYSINVAINLMNALNSDGYWAYIDYSNKYNFPPNQHLVNILQMSQAFVATGALKGNATLMAKIHLAYNYWFEQDYVNDNWWWNAIGFPDYHGPICTLIRDYMTASEKASCTKLMDRAVTDKMTGANLVWTAQVGVWNGIFNNNISFVTLSTNLIWGTSVYFSGDADGVKRDGSFFQHNQIEYSGGYGGPYTSDMLAIIKWTVGTNFNMPTANLESLSAMVLDGQQWMIAYPKLTWDISCKGREITRSGNNLAAFSPKSGLINPGGPRSSEWDQFLQRLAAPQKLIGNKAYWVSDYMIHSRSGWMTSVKMFSTRTANNECVNSEGKQSAHLSDGANFLYQTGDEYYQIFALWDWNLIPGTTTDQVLPLECTHVRTRGKTSFVGVVSDGIYGAAAHDLVGPWSSTIAAKKSWYFFDDEYVALGAGISANANTTIEQKNLRGDVTVATGASTSQIVPQGAKKLTSSAWWVHHDAVGYIFPDTSTDFSLMLDTTTKSGNWLSINTNNLPDTGDTFLLYAPKTSAATYSYIVVPGVSVTSFSSGAAATKRKIQILSNTNLVQAVYHSELYQLHATFWSASSITYPYYSLQVSALKPALLMMMPERSDINLFLSDPSHLLTSTSVSFNKQLTCSGCVYSAGNTVLTVALPTGDFAGQTVKVVLTPVGWGSTSGATTQTSPASSASGSSGTAGATTSVSTGAATTRAATSTTSPSTSSTTVTPAPTPRPSSTASTTSPPASAGYKCTTINWHATLFMILLAVLLK